MVPQKQTQKTPRKDEEADDICLMFSLNKASTGIPRMVNRVSEKSLMYAFQGQKRLIDDHMVRYVVEHEMISA